MKINKNNKPNILAVLAGIGMIGFSAGIFSGVPNAVAAVRREVSAETIMTDKIKDMTATLRVTETNRTELRKIGGAFATTYSLKKMDVTYMNPNKARFEARVLGASVMMIYNGNTKVYRTPIKSGTQDVASKPGQKQTLMDLGIFARDYLTTDYKPNLVRKEGNLLVFKLTQRNTENKSHEVVWVNPKNSVIEKRQSVNGDNILQKEMRFVNPQQIRPGIWVPTRIEIYNQFGKLGAAQAIENIKVNLGVNEDAFKIS